MVVLPRAARPMRQGTADRGNRTILKPDFQTGHPQPRIDHLRAGFSPDSVCLIRRKSPSPTPSPKPSQTGKADSCFLFWHGAGGQKRWRASCGLLRRMYVGRWKSIIRQLVVLMRTKSCPAFNADQLQRHGARPRCHNYQRTGVVRALFLSSRKPEAGESLQALDYPRGHPRVPAGKTVDSADGIRGHYC